MVYCANCNKLLLWCVSNTACLSDEKWLLYTVAFDGLDLGVQHPLLFVIFEPRIGLVYC